MTERYYKQSEASHLKYTVVLCRAAEKTQREQPSRCNVPSVYLPTTVRVIEPETFCTVQGCPRMLQKLVLLRGRCPLLMLAFSNAGSLLGQAYTLYTCTPTC